MDEAKEFLDRIRQGLLALKDIVHADQLQWIEHSSKSRISSPKEASSIVFFLERVALDSRQFELAGLCRYLHEKYNDFEFKNTDTSVRDFCVIFNDKKLLEISESLTPSDIGSLFRPRIHGAYINLLLKELGLVNPSAGGWVATEAGLVHAIQRAHRDGKKPVVIWKSSVIEIIREAVLAGLIKHLPNPWKLSGKRNTKRQCST
ncbi:hypothetical protein [Asticcacaulis sp.]|uniref:hypothetical protein n=1 Tax=Asticcacaulis sp. TaxID=1872648 RepID=UPI00260DD71C|nr:hypothetical protein [Asticcacaulis sp.]